MMKKIFKFLPLLLVGTVSFGATSSLDPSNFQQKYISSIPYFIFALSKKTDIETNISGQTH